MNRRINHLGSVISAATSLLIAGLTGAAVSAGQADASVGATQQPAVSSSVPGWTRAPAGLSVRPGPGAGFPSSGTLAYNTKVTVIGYENGSDVNGDSYWDVIVYKGRNQFVSDYWLYTAGNITQQVPNWQATNGIAEEPGGITLYQSVGTGAYGTLPYGAMAEVICYYTGPSVNGNDYWDYIGYPVSNGQEGALVSDYWLYTGTTITSQVPVC